MFGQEVVELPSQRSERAGLDLDEQSGSADVDDEPIERYLEVVARLRVVALQGGVQRAFVERADKG